MEEFLSSVASKLAEYGEPLAIRHAQYVFCPRKISKKLEDAKEELKLRRDSVHNRVKEAEMNTEKVEDAVHKWLNEVNNVLEEVVNLQQQMTRVQNRRLPDWGRYRLCRQMDMKTNKMTKLIDKANFEPFARRIPLPDLEYLSSGDFTYFQSTEVAHEQLMKAIRDDGSYMIGLYGMGGCGKTTLVKQVLKEAKELNIFDQVVFTTVSRPPNVGKIQDEIAESLGLKFEEKTEDGRARRLSSRLKSGERILIILDDVWSKLNLENIGICWDGSQRGCKVLLTTRRQSVCTSMGCKKIQLHLLSDEEGLILLQKHAKIDDNSASSSSLYEKAREVAKECKGLPLAIAAVGASLRGKKSIAEWRVALHTLRHSKPLNIEEEERDVFACLRLSYDYLNYDLAKSLFWMCGLFPEDHDISKEDLFRYAVGLGFCGEESFEMARSCVNVGINKLIDSCLLMHCEEEEEDEEGQEHVKMHDVVRDVALWVASGEGHPIVVNAAQDVEAKAKESFGLSSWNEDIDKLPDQLDAPKLEALVVTNRKGFNISKTSFVGLKLLRVLTFHFRFKRVRTLQSLSQLTHVLINLRVLRLMGFDLGDISSLVSLKGLEILDLHRSDFIELPDGITTLKRLRLLDLRDCQASNDYNDVAARCSQLKELYVLVRSPGSMKDSYECFLNDATFPKLERYIFQIGRFDCLMSLPSEWIESPMSRRALHVGGLNTSELGTVLKDLVHRAEEVVLESLHGGCKSIIPEMSQAVGGINELKMLSLLRCSEIECLINTADLSRVEAMVPRLVKVDLYDMDNLIEVCRGAPLLSFFQNLRELDIEECPLLQSIFPRTGNLRNLQKLSIDCCPELTSLFTMSVARTMVQLQELDVKYCSELKQIIEINEGDGGEGTSQAREMNCLMFPKLETLSVFICEKLQSIFPRTGNLRNLQTLSIDCCPELTSLFTMSVARTMVQLRDLGVEQCSKLKQIIEINEGDGGEGTSQVREMKMFPKLNMLYVSGCDKLEFILPISCVGDLVVQLTSVRISGCSELKYLFGRYEHQGMSSSQNNDIQIELPSVVHLGLTDLPNLRGLFPENYHSRWPSLKYLSCKGCRKVTTLVSELTQPPQSIERCPVLQSIFPRTGNRCNLQTLIIEGYPMLTSLLTVSVARTMVHLQELHVAQCNELKQIIEINEGDGGEGTSQVREMDCLMFPKLETLSVSSCEKLEFILPVSCVKDFVVQLRSVQICWCSELKYLFGRYEQQGTSSSQNSDIQFELPFVEYLDLTDLLNLRGLFPENYHSRWPSLKYLRCEGCPKFTTSVSELTQPSQI